MGVTAKINIKFLDGHEKEATDKSSPQEQGKGESSQSATHLEDSQVHQQDNNVDTTLPSMVNDKVSDKPAK